jgi:type VI protein secretion system component VasK
MHIIQRIVKALLSVVTALGLTAVVAEVKKWVYVKYHFVLTDTLVFTLVFAAFLMICGVMLIIHLASKITQPWRAERRVKKDSKKQQAFNRRMDSYLESKNNQLKG